MVPLESEQLLDLDEFLTKNAQWASVLYCYLYRMRHGFFERWYLNAILQKDARAPYNLYDAYYFALVHAGLYQGYILSAQVSVRVEPSKDKDSEWNTRALSRLPSPFRCRHLRGWTGGNDGSLEWKEPVEFGQIVRNNIPIVKLIDPMMVPLEIGSTDGSTTVRHLIDGRALARWPYDSNMIYLFYVDDESLWRPPY